jgi:hypothetical protein
MTRNIHLILLSSAHGWLHGTSGRNTPGSPPPSLSRRIAHDSGRGVNPHSLGRRYAVCQGLFYGDAKQFFAQVVGVGANLIYIGLISIVVYKLIDVLIGHRVDPMTEVEGLDIPEMGIPGYVGVKMDKFSETPMSK